MSLSKDKIRILLLEGVHPRAVAVLEEAGYHNLDVRSASLTGDELRHSLEPAHFVGIRSRTQLDAQVLAAAPRLNAVGCFCIGTNQVDLEAAQLQGVPVFNAPFSNTRSVAELVLAEVVMLMRGVPQRNAAAHRGHWLKSASGSHEIRGKTLGIIGYGHIGTQLGVLAEALGMQVIYFDIAEKLPLGNASACPSLTNLLRRADVVSLHVPQTELTEKMIGHEELNSMRQDSFLINASRGSVVDIDALADALDRGHLAGAAIDVFPSEPKSNQDIFESRLRGMDQVLLTPHVGGSTEEAQQNIAQEVASKLVRYSDNGSTLSAVNFPEVAMPDLAGRRRILHIHRNEPGVLQGVNRVFSEHDANIASQYLQTRDRIGYVVMDIETDEPPEDLLAELGEVPGTIRTRVLY
ncbi:MAG: phosphoglycerate dehydrogenase [Xanthomonadales bacterium]|nr:phosphoglycerate dehydrogenase [Xanthomonadales bacterium]